MRRHVASGGCIETALLTLVQCGYVETLEVRTFAPLDIDYLNILSSLDFVGEGRARLDTYVLQGFRERVWQACDALPVQPWAPLYEQDKVGQRVLLISPHGFAGCGNDAGQIFVGGETCPVTRGRFIVEYRCTLRRFK